MAKRLMDLVVSVVGLTLLAPFFLVIAILIKMDARGPVFYTQQRVGKDGVLFNLLKFRTMSVGADKFTAITVGKRDARITRIGFYLRKFKLDELPQLINVLRGEMSLVGPRPELKKFVDLYSTAQKRVLEVKPGITDLASIQFSNENELLEGKPDPVDYYIREIMPLKLTLNLQYIHTRTFWLDCKIIIDTIRRVAKH